MGVKKIELPSNWEEPSLTEWELKTIPPEHVTLAKDLSKINRKLNWIATEVVSTRNIVSEHDDEIVVLVTVRRVMTWLISGAAGIAIMFGLFRLILKA